MPAFYCRSSFISCKILPYVGMDYMSVPERRIYGHSVRSNHSRLCTASSPQYFSPTSNRTRIFPLMSIISIFSPKVMSWEEEVKYQLSWKDPASAWTKIKRPLGPVFRSCFSLLGIPISLCLDFDTDRPDVLKKNVPHDDGPGFSLIKSPIEV